MKFKTEWFTIDRLDGDSFIISEYRHWEEPHCYLLRGTQRNLGGRSVEVLHTPGHSPGHLCFREAARGYLFTGDLVYKDTLFADYPSTDPEAYLASLEQVRQHCR